MSLGNLPRYIEAIGGSLELTAKIPAGDDEHRLLGEMQCGCQDAHRDVGMISRERPNCKVTCAAVSRKRHIIGADITLGISLNVCMSKKSDLVDIKPTSNAAPGQFLGFGLQPVRLCARLLAADGDDLISTEFLDDVAVRCADSRIVLEQNKSALSHNPVSDWALDLWKTFANWLATTKQLNLNANTTEYVLYVCPKHTGKWVERLHSARTRAHVEEIVAEINAALKDRGSIPTGCAEHLRAFLDADTELRATIVRNFSLLTCAGDPVEEIRRFLKPTVSPEVCDDICTAAIGWVKSRADDLIREKNVAEIKASAFHKWLRALVKRHDRDHVLRSFAGKPSRDAVQSELNVRTYIKQLEVINLEADEKVHAASDFLLASADRTLWAERGAVNEASLKEFDGSLARNWSLARQANAIVHRDRDEVERGQLLYIESMRRSERVQDMDVPPHFVPGTFHALADHMTVGWHPRYNELLQGQGETSDGR